MKTLLAASILLAAACASGNARGDGEIVFVATTTILGDLARNVAGAESRIEVLMPVDADPHDFRPSSRQIAMMAQADLIVANGLGLEEGLADALESASSDGAPVIEVGDVTDPIPLSSGGPDPHVWMDPIRMADAARGIGGRLEELLPGRGWADRAEAYSQDLEAADTRIRGLLDSVADDARLLVTNHDSLGYFANRYDLQVVGVVIPGGSTLAEPSSAQLASLVETIRATGTRVIFAETTSPKDLADAVAAEVDAHIEIVELHTGSLGPAGSDTDTLIGMLTENARRIAEALT